MKIKMYFYFITTHLFVILNLFIAYILMVNKMYNYNIRKAKQLKRKYKNILKEITFIGITGTNGKTTTTTLIYKYYKFINKNVTLIGTNGIYINDEYYETINTTPGIEKIYEIINESYNKGVRIIIMEVSSHAILQHRIYGIKFKIKAITNITQDHLDYHKSFKKYKKTKLSFLNKSIIIKSDLVKNNKINLFNKVYTYGKNDSYFWMKDIILNNNGLEFKLLINNNNYNNKYNYYYNIKSNLLGEFNCYNILLFISIIYILKDFNYFILKQFLNQRITIDGRMEVIKYHNKTIIIDYAHTPDGMDKVLSFVKKNYNGKIITIFGCGGNRDCYKRKIMGEISSKYSDLIIVTSDNPRNENEIEIINDILDGINNNYITKVNRKDAISLGFNLLTKYDVLLILGRGNESNLKINDKLIPFNDIEYVKELIKKYE